MGKSWENPGKTLDVPGTLWELDGNLMGVEWDSNKETW